MWYYYFKGDEKMSRVKGENSKLLRLGEVLKEARLSAGWSQKKAADELECSQSFVAQCEAGDMVDLSSSMLKALAELYGVNYRDVVAKLVEEKYGVDFTAGKQARDLSLVLLEREMEALRGKLSRLKNRK
jgi:transcriptional regulator with XRE-family HTH domain